MTNKQLLGMIGEIDGITLRSVGKYSVGVFLQIGSTEYELMRDSGEAISHHITRIGIGSQLEKAGAPIGKCDAVEMPKNVLTDLPPRSSERWGFD